LRESDFLQSHRLTVQEKYFNQIRRGEKTIEGRVWDKTIVNFHVGDIVIINGGELSIRCRIKALIRYDSFYQMLQLSGYKNFLPDAETLDDAVAVYHSFPSYEERARLHGVVAIYLKLE
jgi:ASC-1-like (ASCH) protein